MNDHVEYRSFAGSSNESVSESSNHKTAIFDIIIHLSLKYVHSSLEFIQIHSFVIQIHSSFKFIHHSNSFIIQIHSSFKFIHHSLWLLPDVDSDDDADLGLRVPIHYGIMPFVQYLPLEPEYLLNLAFEGLSIMPSVQYLALAPEYFLSWPLNASTLCELSNIWPLPEYFPSWPFDSSGSMPSVHLQFKLLNAR